MDNKTIETIDHDYTPVNKYIDMTVFEHSKFCEIKCQIMFEIYS